MLQHMQGLNYTVFWKSWMNVFCILIQTVVCTYTIKIYGIHKIIKQVDWEKWTDEEAWKQNHKLQRVRTKKVCVQVKSQKDGEMKNQNAKVKGINTRLQHKVKWLNFWYIMSNAQRIEAPKWRLCMPAKSGDMQTEPSLVNVKAKHLGLCTQSVSLSTISIPYHMVTKHWDLLEYDICVLHVVNILLLNKYCLKLY